MVKFQTCNHLALAHVVCIGRGLDGGELVVFSLSLGSEGLATVDGVGQLGAGGIGTQ
jgi:hypothetical protein